MYMAKVRDGGIAELRSIILSHHVQYENHNQIRFLTLNEIKYILIDLFLCLSKLIFKLIKLCECDKILYQRHIV